MSFELKRIIILPSSWRVGGDGCAVGDTSGAIEVVTVALIVGIVESVAVLLLFVLLLSLLSEGVFPPRKYAATTIPAKINTRNIKIARTKRVNFAYLVFWSPEFNQVPKACGKLFIGISSWWQLEIP